MDTLHPERLKMVMRFASIEEVLAGIAAAEEAGLLPIKINCTVTRDYNDGDVVDLARRARDSDWHVRFIELMPLGGGETAHVALLAVRALGGDPTADRGGARAARADPEPAPLRRGPQLPLRGRGAASWASSRR